MRPKVADGKLHTGSVRPDLTALKLKSGRTLCGFQEQSDQGVCGFQGQPDQGVHYVISMRSLIRAYTVVSKGGLIRAYTMWFPRAIL